MPKQFHGLRSLTTLALLALVPAAAAAAIGTEVADVRAGGDAVVWQPQIHDYDRLTLIVAGPGGTITREFGAGETPAFSLYDAAGGLVADGLYKWELRVTPRIDPATRRAMEAEREGGGARRILGQLRASGELPATTYQSGSFSVVGGALVMPGDVEETPGGGVRSMSDGVRSTSAEVVLTNANGVIRNALCVGFDCPDSPAFGDSSVLMMENNNRIKFGDTSVSPFPNNDWEIEANSSLSGGANYLGFNDCGTADNDGSCATDLVFAVEAGVRQNALYVESDGDVGVGTSNPVLDLHIVTGNTPGIRLEQDGSSGFTPQTWDIAGNEANFFVRDVTGGSSLPFRIEPGTASSTLYLDSNERVGIGTSAPATTLHVQRSDATAGVQVQETSGTVATRSLLTLTNNGGAGFTLENSNSAQLWRIDTGGADFNITLIGTGELAELAPTGDLTITGEIFTAGSCMGGCDEVFAPEFELRTIEEHSALMWRNRHLPAVGPTAENGRWNLSRKTGGILHELEVAHIYIQQLNDRVKAKTDELAELEQHNAELAEQRLPELERANAELAARLAALEALVQQLAD